MKKQNSMKKQIMKLIKQNLKAKIPILQKFQQKCHSFKKVIKFKCKAIL